LGFERIDLIYEGIATHVQAGMYQFCCCCERIDLIYEGIATSERKSNRSKIF